MTAADLLELSLLLKQARNDTKQLGFSDYAAQLDAMLGEVVAMMWERFQGEMRGAA